MISEKNKKIIILCLILFLILAAALAGYFFYRQKSLQSVKKPSVVSSNSSPDMAAPRANAGVEHNADYYTKYPVAKKPDEIKRTTEGVVLSKNEGHIYLKITDTKGDDLRINAKTVVLKQGSDSKGDVSLIEKDQKISAKINEFDYVDEIIIEQ